MFDVGSRSWWTDLTYVRSAHGVGVEGGDQGDLLLVGETCLANVRIPGGLPAQRVNQGLRQRSRSQAGGARS